MKKLLVVLSLFALLQSCEKEDANSVKGEWKLIEQLIDPGDGSGTYETVESDLTLWFEKNNVLKSNGALCNMSTESGNQKFKEAYTSNKIEVNSCFQGDVELNYELSEGFIILHYQCFEGCSQKFERQ